MSAKTRLTHPPFAQKLPVIIGGLLLVVIVALSSAAYVEVRRSARHTASERLTSVAQQFRDLFQQSAGQIRARATTTAKQPTLAEFARTRNPRLRSKALAELRSGIPQPEQVVATELRDSAGAVILTTTPPASTLRLDTVAIDDALRLDGRTDSATIGKFRLLSDTIVYPVVAAVSGGRDHKTYIVRWRRLAGSRRTREQLTNLVGSDARILFGNADGTTWTDLERAIPAPDPDDRQHVAASALIPGTPWRVAVDFPTRNVMAPAENFLRRITIMAALAIALALLAAWLMRQRLKSTLDQLHDAQEALVRRERLALLGQLSSGVGHELRNPLGVMTNAVYYLKTVLASAPHNVHEYLDIIQQQVTLSEKIVGDLLDFARSKPPRRTPTRVRDATESQLSRLGATNGIRIETHIPDNLPPVLVDPVQLGQIILNLLTNATQAIEGKGEGRINVSARTSDHSVHYEIQDTGPGVALENAEKIFEPLFTTKARGIGLGLAVSRTLARANGGDLTVQSTPGQGATFRLTLPIAS